LTIDIFNRRTKSHVLLRIVPVVSTGIVLFPFLLYIIFAEESLIPLRILMHELPEEARTKKPVNPNIPHARGAAEEEEAEAINDEQGQLLSLEEIMNPFLDKGGAIFGAVVMATALITLLSLNASSAKIGEHPVYWVTLPAATVMFTFDVTLGWIYRKETREIAARGREDIERAHIEKTLREEDEAKAMAEKVSQATTYGARLTPTYSGDDQSHGWSRTEGALEEKATVDDEVRAATSEEMDEKRREDLQTRITLEMERRKALKVRPTLESRLADAHAFCQMTFPTAAAVLSHLPYALLPFAFGVFVLVQSLLSRGWIAVFAYGWSHWVDKTGTIGAIGGMGLAS
jgi:hypothetical protein